MCVGLEVMTSTESQIQAPAATASEIVSLSIVDVSSQVTVALRFVPTPDQSITKENIRED